MFEILNNVRNGSRHASDILGFALWWLCRHIAWVCFAIVLALALYLLTAAR